MNYINFFALIILVFILFLLSLVQLNFKINLELNLKSFVVVVVRGVKVCRGLKLLLFTVGVDSIVFIFLLALLGHVLLLSALSCLPLFTVSQ